MEHILIHAVGWLLTGLALCSAGYALAVSRLVDRFGKHAAALPASHAPVTLLKPLHFDEPGLEENLASFVTQDYAAPVQLIFGVQDAKDPAIETVQRLKERKVATIDRDNFNDVLAKATPRVAMKVANKLGDPNSQLAVELNFKNIDDFEPARVAEQVGPLKELLEMRNKLTALMSKMEGNDKLEQLLGEVLGNTEKAMSLAKEMGLEGQAPEGEAKKEEATE